MKKLLRISFLLVVLCLAVPVYADGDMPTGTRTCTQNCGTGGGLYDGSTIDPLESGDDQTVESDQNDSTIEDIYSWIYEQISEIVG